MTARKITSVDTVDIMCILSVTPRRNTETVISISADGSYWCHDENLYYEMLEKRAQREAERLAVEQAKVAKTEPAFVFDETAFLSQW